MRDVELARWIAAAANSGGAGRQLSADDEACLKDVRRRLWPAPFVEITDGMLTVPPHPLERGPIHVQVHEGRWSCPELLDGQVGDMEPGRAQHLRRLAGLANDELAPVASSTVSTVRWVDVEPGLTAVRDKLQTLGAASPDGLLTVAGAVALGVRCEELAGVDVVLVSGGVAEATQRGLGGTRLARLAGHPRDIVAAVGEYLLQHRLHPGRLALQEVLVNALSHRCYSPLRVHEPIRVEIYLDAFAVRSPGPMLRRVGFRDGAVQEPHRRNPRLHALLKLRGLADGQGRGLPVLAEVAGFSVHIRRRPDDVRVLLVRDGSKQSPPAGESREAQVLRLLAGGSMTRVELQEALGVKRATTQGVLKKLVADGRVVREAASPKSPGQRYRLA